MNAKKSVKFSAPVSALVTIEDASVTVQLEMPKGLDNAHRDALIGAHAYRLAAEICMLNADVGARIALDTTRARIGRIVIEMTAAQNATAVETLVADALKFERIASRTMRTEG